MALGIGCFAQWWEGLLGLPQLGASQRVCSCVQVLLIKCLRNYLLKSQGSITHHTKHARGVYSFHTWAQLFTWSLQGTGGGGGGWVRSSHSTPLSDGLCIVSFDLLALMALSVTWVESVSSRPGFYIIFSIILIHILNLVFLPRNILIRKS